MTHRIEMESPPPTTTTAAAAPAATSSAAPEAPAATTAEASAATAKSATAPETRPASVTRRLRETARLIAAQGAGAAAHVAPSCGAIATHRIVGRAGRGPGSGTVGGQIAAAGPISRSIFHQLRDTTWEKRCPQTRPWQRNRTCSSRSGLPGAYSQAKRRTRWSIADAAPVKAYASKVIKKEPGGDVVE
jgi:hypothetical protein